MKDIIKLTFVGDVMCNREMIGMFRQDNSFEFNYLFEDIKEYLSESDYVVANLETPLSKNEEDFSNERYSFCSPIEFGYAIKNNGIDYVSTANNHCLDRGVNGLLNNINCLDIIPIKHTGTFSSHNREESIVTVEDVNLGFLSYTYGTNAFANNQYLKRDQQYMVNLFQRQELSNPIRRYAYHHYNKISSKVINKCYRILRYKNSRLPIYEQRESRKKYIKKLSHDIRAIKEKSDIVCMCIHMGGQYNEAHTKDSEQLMQLLFDEGVDIVIGNHEHVVHEGFFQKLDVNKVGVYCLGNFCSIAGVIQSPFDKMAEYSIIFHVFISKKTKEIQKVSFSITKSVMRENQLHVSLLYDLICQEHDNETKEDLLNHMRNIYTKFTGKSYEKEEREFLIYSRD